MLKIFSKKSDASLTVDAEVAAARQDLLDYIRSRYEAGQIDDETLLGLSQQAFGPLPQAHFEATPAANDAMHCHACGSPINGQDVYCPHCGHAQQPIAESAPLPGPVAPEAEVPQVTELIAEQAHTETRPEQHALPVAENVEPPQENLVGGTLSPAERLKRALEADRRGKMMLQKQNLKTSSEQTSDTQGGVMLNRGPVMHSSAYTSSQSVYPLPGEDVPRAHVFSPSIRLTTTPSSNRQLPVRQAAQSIDPVPEPTPQPITLNVQAQASEPEPVAPVETPAESASPEPTPASVPVVPAPESAEPEATPAEPTAEPDDSPEEQGPVRKRLTFR